MTANAELSEQRVAAAAEIADTLAPALIAAAEAAINAANSARRAAGQLLRSSSHGSADRQEEMIAGALSDMRQQIEVFAEAAAAAVAAAE